MLNLARNTIYNVFTVDTRAASNYGKYAALWKEH